MYTIIIVSENKPGVLHRITGILMRRKINIENLNVYEIKKLGVLQITITVTIQPTMIDALMKQIDNIVEIEHSTYHTVYH